MPMTKRTLIDDEGPQFALQCKATVYANGTQTYSFKRVNGGAPNGNFTNAVYAWKGALGIYGRPIRDEMAHAWIIPDSWDVDPFEAVKALKEAFAHNNIGVEVEMHHEQSDYIVRESSLT